MSGGTGEDGATRRSALAWPEGVGLGTVLDGKYRLERVVGSGGMGFVVEATHTLLQERVAVKFPRADRSKKPEARKRFLREARAAFAVRSDHVVRVLDFGVVGRDNPFIVMEYLEGTPLSEILSRRGALGIEEAAGLAFQAMRGVEAVHRAGIVHRDLKPGNLLAVTLAGGQTSIRVLDFGLARPEVAVEGHITESGEVLGSVAYMSPEQLRGCKVDVRSDVWALGVILYELVSGRRPFDGCSHSAIVAKILVEPPAPLDAGAIPAAVAALVLRCLAKNPVDRFRSVGELSRALAEQVEGGPDSAGPIAALPETADDSTSASNIFSTAIESAVSGGRKRGLRRESLLRGLATGAVTALAAVGLWSLASSARSVAARPSRAGSTSVVASRQPSFEPAVAPKAPAVDEAPKAEPPRKAPAHPTLAGAASRAPVYPRPPSVERATETRR